MIYVKDVILASMEECMRTLATLESPFRSFIMTFLPVLLAVDPDADKVWFTEPLVVATASHYAFEEGQRQRVVSGPSFAFALSIFGAADAAAAIDDACSAICLSVVLADVLTTFLPW